MILNLRPQNNIGVTVATVATQSMTLRLTPVLLGTAGDTVSEQPITATTSASVAHNLARCPFVQVIDNAGHVIDANVQHVNTNQFVVNFNEPVTGKILYI